MMLMYYFFLFN